jgi:hypothetical protein
MPDQGHNEKNKEDEKQDLGNIGCPPCYSAKAKQPCYEGDNEKDHSPIQHKPLLSLTDFSVQDPASVRLKTRQALMAINRHR